MGGLGFRCSNFIVDGEKKGFLAIKKIKIYVKEEMKGIKNKTHLDLEYFMTWYVLGI